VIARDAVPIGHRPPYKRIDLAHPNRKQTIRLEFEMQSIEVFEVVYAGGFCGAGGSGAGDAGISGTGGN